MIRALISEKLGVCPFCMRTSALGSLIGWTCVAALRALEHGRGWPAALTLVAVVAATALTLLITAHLVAYMVRSGARLRMIERARAAHLVSAPGMTRRRFVGLVLQSGAHAAAIALFGQVPAFGGTDTCTGPHTPDTPVVTAVGDDEASARANYETFALLKCEITCNVRACLGGKACTFNSVRPIGKEQPVCTPRPPEEGGGFTCTGAVKECTCQCDACQGDHRHPRGAGFDDASGMDGDRPTSENKARDRAREMCDKLCARMTDCTNNRTCKRIGEPDMTEVKSYLGHPQLWFASTRVKSCKCNCVS